MTTRTFRLPKDLDDALTALANRLGVSRAVVMRKALDALIAQERLSVRERAQDLIGLVEGPQDLSTNPKHMRGYGQ